MTATSPETPAPTVPPIDVERYTKLLLKIEQHAHRHGWDGPVFMQIIVDEDLVDPGRAMLPGRRSGAHPRYDAVSHGRYTAYTLFNHHVLHRPWSDFPPDVREHLRDQERNYPKTGAGPQPFTTARHLVLKGAYMPDPEAVTMRNILRQPGVLGFTVVGEAWRNTGAAVMGAARGEHHLGDLPDSIETRVVYSVDLAARVYRVERVRSQKPGLLVRDVPGEEWTEHGEVEAVVDPLLRGDFTTTLRIMRDTVLDRLPQGPDAFATRYPTLRDLHEARCSDPREPDGCPREDHVHNVRDFRVVRGRWYRGGDW